MSEQRKFTPAEALPAQPSEQASPLATAPEPVANAEPHRIGRRDFLRVAGGVATAIGGATLPDFLRGRSAAAAPATGGEVLPPQPAAATDARVGRNRMSQPLILKHGEPVVLRRQSIDDVDAAPEVTTIRLGESDKVVELQHFGGNESFAKLKAEAELKYKDRVLPSAEDRVTLASSASGQSVIREADMQLEAADSGGFDLGGHHVPEPFAGYWTSHGGLAQQGLPITELYQEYNPTNNVQYPTQYFERARFEDHQEYAGTPNEVLLGLLGREQYLGKYKGQPAPNETAYNGADKTVFNETGKSVNPNFMQYWLGHGGLAQQGLPISEQFMEKSPLDGNDYLVQYFERARFEAHPENQPPYDVLLGLLGIEQHGNPEPSPVFEGWRSEIGELAKDGLVIHNRSTQVGYEDGMDPQNNFQAVVDAKNQYAPGKFEFFFYENPDDVQKLIDPLVANGYKPDYDTNVQWETQYAGTGMGKVLKIQTPDGVWQQHLSIPGNVKPEDRNRFNRDTLTSLLSFFYRKDKIGVTQPTGYADIIKKLALDPYNSGKMNFALKTVFKQ